MNKALKVIISILLSGVILYFLFKNIDISSLKEISKKGYIALTFSFIMFFFIKLINTFRYSKIYGIKSGINLFSFLSYSNLMLSIVPFRMGEFLYIHGFKKYFGKKYLEGANKLIFLRFIDYIIIFFLFLLSSIYVYGTIGKGIIGQISIFFIMSLILFWGFVYLVAFSRFSFRIKEGKLIKIIEIIRFGVANIKKVPNKIILSVILLSFIYWSLRLVMGYIILFLLGIKISFFAVVFISLLLLLVGVLPIQTFLNFGIFEGGWTYFLVLLGYNYGKILPLTLQYHLITILPAIIFGIFGYIYIRIKNYFSR